PPGSATQPWARRIEQGLSERQQNWVHQDDREDREQAESEDSHRQPREPVAIDGSAVLGAGYEAAGLPALPGRVTGGRSRFSRHVGTRSPRRRVKLKRSRPGGVAIPIHPAIAGVPSLDAA